MENRSPFVTGITLLILAILPASSFGQDDGPARKLINSQGCKACHTLEGDGGRLADSFEKISARLTQSEIRQQLVNQEQRHGHSSIPDFSHLREEELKALVDFIQAIQINSKNQ